ncbi:cell division protein FtsQ/DivIB [Ideonella sp. BN130291]|uniref:cell division protein FtsQ/DivIB n=1 Tax=Ideonella sp. BN130291 TaxID=3112940 RepID=UPI002E264235|nr:cell division protein FtsQ/DivIB [Ideonella sp. BN130291]
MATFAPSTNAMPVDIRLMNGIANAVFALVGMALAVAALLWLARLPVFAFRVVKIEGDLGRNSVSTIRANAMPRLAGNFFTMDLARTRSAFEAVPWVRKAVVHRVWPSTLRVELVEHHPAALWQDMDGTDKLVNTEGDVFEANVGDVEDDGLPALSGPDGSSARVLAMYQRLAPMFERLDAGVEGVAMSGRGSWRVMLDTGAEVELGRGEEPEVLARTDRFVRTVTQVTGRFERPLAYADLRHADGYAVKLKGITTTLPPAGTAKARKH